MHTPVKSLICAFAAVFVASDRVVVGAQAQLSFTGHYLGTGPWTRADGEWLALEHLDDGVVLRTVTVRAKREKPICGEVGFNVSAAGVAAGTFLVRGIPVLRPGPVRTVFSGSRYVAPGTSLSSDDGSGWSLKAEGIVSPNLNAARGEMRTTRYRLSIERGGVRATVFTMTAIANDGPPQIIWVGYLDGDDIPDVLADVPVHWPGHDYTLFLSSSATVGELIGKTAAVSTVGC